MNEETPNDQEFEEVEEEGYNPLLDWGGEEITEDTVESFGPAGLFSTDNLASDLRQIDAENYVDYVEEDDEGDPYSGYNYGGEDQQHKIKASSGGLVIKTAKF